MRQRGVAVGGGVGQPPGGQVDAGAQDGQSRLGRDALQRRLVGGAQDAVGFLQLAQVDQGSGEREQRLRVAGIGGDPAVAAGGIAQQVQGVANLSVVPGDNRAGDQGRCRDGAAMPTGSGQHGVGRRPGELVAQPGQRLQMPYQRLVPQVTGQLRPGKDQLGLGGGILKRTGRAQDRGQGAAQPVLGRRRQRPGQHVRGDPGGLVKPPGGGQGFGGGHRAGQRTRIVRRRQLQRAHCQLSRGPRRRTRRLRRRPVQPG